MTKKDYITIGRAIKPTWQIFNRGDENDMINVIVDCLCIALKQDNPNFNRDKFIEYLNR